ncbi:hypothetical protein V512_006590 [Mesotoga sp. Brook.08.105.5.1]|nr:hypothetical protein V512_006590 [Mesotoga sp. Brook.08.105.5.1]
MMPTSSGSEARWRVVVMPGETFGEVMRRKASAEVMPPSVGRNALKSISDSNACFAGKLILVQRALSYHEAATPNPGLLLFLATCILELATELLQAISGSLILSAQRFLAREAEPAFAKQRLATEGDWL